MVPGPDHRDFPVAAGDTLAYEGIRQVTTVTGEPVAEILLRLPSGRRAAYRTSLSEERLREAQQIDIPFAVELCGRRRALKAQRQHILYHHLIMV